VVFLFLNSKIIFLSISVTTALHKKSE